MNHEEKANEADPKGHAEDEDEQNSDEVVVAHARKARRRFSQKR